MRSGRPTLARFSQCEAYYSGLEDRLTQYRPLYAASGSKKPRMRSQTLENRKEAKKTQTAVSQDLQVVTDSKIVHLLL